MTASVQHVNVNIPMPLLQHANVNMPMPNI